jgi:hypothetical protein
MAREIAMGFPDQAPGQGQPGFPGDQGSPVPQPGYQQPGYEQSGYQQPGWQQQGYQQPGYQPGYAPGYQPGPPAKNNNLAIASLVCGCAQFVLWWIILIPGFLSAIAALALGLVSMRQIQATGEGGRGMAVAGVVLGALGVLGGLIWIVLIVVGAATSTTTFH